jgi:hypothetical protein
MHQIIVWGRKQRAAPSVFNTERRAEWVCMLVPRLGSAVAEAWLIKVLIAYRYYLAKSGPAVFCTKMPRAV